MRERVQNLILPALIGAVLGVACSGNSRADDEPPPARADHVILMVADGAGFNTWLATSLFEGEFENDPFDDGTWIRTACDTYPLREEIVGVAQPAVAPEPLQDATLVYDPVRAWDGTPVKGAEGGYPYFFSGYRWLRRSPDSANTATAMSTGQRTYIGAINVDGRGDPIEPTIATLADASRRSIGIVTTVPFSHATPAAFAGTHHESRGAYADLALQMLGSDRLDFVAGCGNPDFDDDGVRVDRPEPDAYRWVGGPEAWGTLTGREIVVETEEPAGDTRALTAEETDQLATWTLVQSRDDIEALSTGPMPDRPLLVPQVALTLQQARHALGDTYAAEPFADPLLPNVPDLAMLTRVALRSLSENPDGFFLHVEGGAVDWAMHDNQMGRMIEEMIDFRRAVEAVEEWVERESDWSHTLLILTADHDHMLWGPDAGEVPFAPLRDEGEGNAPGHRWLSDSHSNALVPLLAKGVGAEQFLQASAGVDPVRGPYVHQTRIFDVVADVLQQDAREGRH